jgi:hypothetical protein
VTFPLPDDRPTATLPSPKRCFNKFFSGTQLSSHGFETRRSSSRSAGADLSVA